MINFVDPNLDPGPQIREVNNRILRGMSVTAATSEENPGTGMADDGAMANVLADKEDFNTRYGSLNGWREAVRKVKPSLRVPAQFSLSNLVLSAQPRTTTEVVDLMLASLPQHAAGRKLATCLDRLPRQRARHLRHRAS